MHVCLIRPQMADEVLLALAMLFFMLQSEYLFLLLYLFGQFFFRWEVGEVLGLEYLFITMQHAITGHILTGLRAEEQADGGVIALGAL